MLIEKPTGEIRTAYDHDYEPYLFEATGKEAKHFCDILRAEDDGRLVILPCKVGDTVWYIPSGTRKIYSGVCHCVSIQRGGVNIHLYDFDGDNATYSANRVFLTREEAEAAMKGRQDNGTA